MKKTVALVVSMFCVISGFALPVGNPWDASLLTRGVFCGESCTDFCDPNFSLCNALSLRVGFYADYIYDRKLQIDREDSHKDIRKTTIFTNGGLIALNLCNRLDLYTILGATHLRLDANQLVFALTNFLETPFTLETDTRFSYTVGAKLTLLQFCGFELGIDGRYFHTKLDVKYVENTLSTSIYYDDLSVKYDEWQFAGGIAYCVNIAPSIATVPYLAAKWNRCRLDFDNFLTGPIGAVTTPQNLQLYNLENQRNFGYVFGISLVGCGKWDITAEWAFVNELAFHVNTQFRF